MIGKPDLIAALRPKESFTWLAETVHGLSRGRIVTAFGLSLIVLSHIAGYKVALWLAAVLMGELWQRRSAIGLLNAAVETPAVKLRFIMAFSANTLAWSSLGDLAWSVSGRVFHGICMVIWMTQFMLAALYTFRSRIGYIVGTVCPVAAVMFALAPTLTPLSMDRLAELAAGGLGPIFAFALATQMDKQRHILDQTLKQLEQAAADAARAASAKSEFLANMSHELRTPLTAILGFSKILKDSKSLGIEDAKQADRINTASRTLLTVVNDVLDFSKMEAGALELEAEALDPISLMTDALDMVAEAAAAKGLGLRLETTGAPLHVVGDPVRLRQVLLNLVNNAVKFTSRGEIVGAVGFDRLSERTCRVRFEVRDTGLGIAEDKRALIFERFSQADGSITRQFGGTGLGLAICKRIVTLMNGVIDVQSEPGKGSVFWLDLDLPVAHQLVAEPDAPADEDLEELEVRALVVEDHPANQELLRIFLEMAGVTVQIVDDGAQAVDAYRNGAFDIILMDAQMPVMDGPEATRRIRALEGDGWRVPIIAMTANVMSEQVNAYFAAGMDAHVSKPIDSSVLVKTVHHWVAQSKAKRAQGKSAKGQAA
jgi:signal transduction histidine kinase/CheY-like chemotaxis protein